MLDALNKTVVVELKEHFSLSDVYFVLRDSEEYLNIAQRKTQFDLDTKELRENVGYRLMRLEKRVEELERQLKEVMKIVLYLSEEEEGND